MIPAVLGSGLRFQVADVVILGVAVPVVDMPTLGDSSVVLFPDDPMKEAHVGG